MATKQRKLTTTTKLERLANKIGDARTRIAKIMVSEFDADPEIADLLASDVIRQLLTPTKKQMLRAWWTRRRKAVTAAAASTAVTLAVACCIVAAVILYPPTYPRSYAVSDTWRGTARNGIFDGSYKVDAEGGRCFISNGSQNKDCASEGILPTINAAIDDAVRQNKEGAIWDGPNGNGEHWVIERRGRLLTITATEQ